MSIRTLELYGFLKGDSSLIKEGLKVRILDKNLIDRTDPSETFFVKQTSAGFVYKVRAKGDDVRDTPTDTKTGLYDDEEFYIVFQNVGIDIYGQPARSSDGTLFTYTFKTGLLGAINLDLYLLPFSFTVNYPPGEYQDRPILYIQTKEEIASFLITFTGQVPVKGSSYTTEVLERQNIEIPNDGQVIVRIAPVDFLGNILQDEAFIYNIAYPTVKVFEAIPLKEIKAKRFFYPIAYILQDNGVYTEIPSEELDNLILEANSNLEALEDLYYTLLEPGVNSGTIYAPRFVKLASNRPGVIGYQIIRNGIPETPSLTTYDPSIVIDLSPSDLVLSTRVFDKYETLSPLVTRVYKPVAVGPVIERVSVNDGETTVLNRNIIVNVLTKGGAPQVITIGQNPALYPIQEDSPIVWSGDYRYDCQYACGFGHGYGFGYGYGDPNAINPDSCDPYSLKFGIGEGYDRKAYLSNWCLEDCPTTMVHTAFNERTPFVLCDKEGQQCIFIRARSFDGVSLPIVTFCVTLDATTTAPTLSVDPVCSEIKQTQNRYTITGTKGAYESIWINGIQRVPPNNEVVWSYQVTLSSGKNVFSIHSKNQFGRISETVEVSIKYEFVFTGLPSAVVRADAEGHWTVIGLGLGSGDCGEQSQVYEIIVETPGLSLSPLKDSRNVYVVEKPLEAVFVSPQHFAPVCKDTQKVEFNLTNPNLLKFYGPYQVQANDVGEWWIDGVALDPALFVDSLNPNMEIVVSVTNTDGTTFDSVTPINVQVIDKVQLLLNGVSLGQDFLPPFSDLNCLTLKGLKNGRQELSLIITEKDTGFSSRSTKTFLVDTQDPTVKIISPKEGEGIYTDLPPILEYEIITPEYIKDKSGQTANIPLLRVSVLIDGVDFGEIRSGERLPVLTDGYHTIQVIAETITRDEVRISRHACDGYGYGYGYGYGPTEPCHLATDRVRINYIRPISIEMGAVGDRWLNIGTNIDGKIQAEAVFEELRILNRASTDMQILQDWRLLLNGLRFRNEKETIVLSEEEQKLIAEKDLSIERLSIPDQTLVLMHFDNSYQSIPGVDNRITLPSGVMIEYGRYEINPATQLPYLVVDNTPLDLLAKGNPIIDQRTAVNQLAIDVFVKKGEHVDKDLVLESINRIIPARGEALVSFVES